MHKLEQEQLGLLTSELGALDLTSSYRSFCGLPVFVFAFSCALLHRSSGVIHPLLTENHLSTLSGTHHVTPGWTDGVLCAEDEMPDPRAREGHRRGSRASDHLGGAAAATVSRRQPWASPDR